MANSYLYRTQGTGSSYDIWTLSMWVKRSGLGSLQGLMSTAGGWNTGGGMAIMFSDADVINIYNPSQGSTGGNYNQCTRKFRDTSAWYHLVFRADSTQGTQADRMKVYINGVQETSFNMGNLPTQGTDWNNVNRNGETLQIGRGGNGGSTFFDGIMTHVHFIDGTSYDASAFGETDTTTGEWKAKTSPSVTYGNNGFLILKDGNTITDQSSNSNNFTLGGGTLTNLKDNPDNVFATLNPLAGTAIGSYTNGNNRVVGVSTSWTTAPSTLAVSSGKFYCEAKAQHTSLMVGILDIDQMITNNFQGTKSNGWGYEGTGTLWNNGNPTTSWGSTYTTGDIIGIAMDLDNNKLYFSKNGTWQNSANPSAGTGGISITADKTYYFAMSPVDSTSSVIEANFGNGYFGTTAVSSAGTNASDNGIFEYDVPTGYTALSTKGLNL